MKLLALAMSLTLWTVPCFSQQNKSVILTVTGVQGNSSVVGQISNGQGAKFEVEGDKGWLTLPKKQGDSQTIELKLTKAAMPYDDEDCRSSFSLVGRDNFSVGGKDRYTMFIGSYTTRSSAEKCQNRDTGTDTLFLGSWDLDANGKPTTMGNFVAEGK